MFLLFYVDDCLLFIPSKDKIDEVYECIQENSKIKDDVELKKYLGIELDRLLYGFIHLSQPYLTQISLNRITGMGRSRSKPTPTVNPPP